jgi:hypothetical protein
MAGKEELIEKRLKEGWIKTRMMIEVLAVSEDAAKSSLEKHVEKMEKEKKVVISAKDFHKIEKVENPLPNLPVGYSNIVSLEVLTENFETLINLIMNYAPSSAEILTPQNIKIDMGEAQGILNSLSGLLHKFAAHGLGGVLIGS